MNEKVLVAMSGGVDSSVAALLLKEQGYEPVGVTMRLWNLPEADAKRQGCCSLDDVEDAKRVADQLGIPHYTLNMKDAFRENVVDYFVDEYRHGRTPNPCIACNRVLKFNMLVERAAQMGIDKLATGHYARIVREGERYLVARGKDEEKDQSYFLFDIPPKNLPKILFPLGEITKEEARAAAERAGLKTAQKAESQEICFVPDDDYGSFLNGYGLPSREGDIVTPDGKVLGKHKGTQNYTIGQRRGLGIGHAHRLYVTAIDAEKNRITVGPESELLTGSMVITGLTAHLPVKAGEEFGVQVRYRQKPVKGIIESVEADKIKIKFLEPVGSVAPGQAGVFYRDDVIVCGGWITVEE
jgi:tRNA-specific 2-thiouridylase